MVSKKNLRKRQSPLLPIFGKLCCDIIGICHALHCDKDIGKSFYLNWRYWFWKINIHCNGISAVCVHIFSKNNFFLKNVIWGYFLTLITNLALVLPYETYLPCYCQVLPRYSKKFFWLKNHKKTYKFIEQVENDAHIKIM